MKIVTPAAIAALSLTLAACGSSQEPSTPPPSAGGSGSPAAVVAADTRALFAPAMSDLQTRVQIPVRVPARLGNIGQGDKPVFAAVEAAGADRYSIVLGTSAGCSGATYCRLGTIAAEKIAGDTIRREGGQRVTLQGGVPATYFEDECGANCPDNTIVWDQDGVRYTLGIKSGRQEQLVQLANDTIAR